VTPPTVQPIATPTAPSNPSATAGTTPSVTAIATAPKPAAPTTVPTSAVPVPGPLPTAMHVEKTVPPPARSEGAAILAADVSAAAKVQAVRDYYALLEGKEFEKAYAALSPAFQNLNPFERWSSGYAGLSSLAYTVSANADGSVAVTVTTREASSAGGETVREYGGRWLLIFSAERSQWLLERAEITRLNK
ncbi:MAG: hypothetical protein ACYC7H_10085, partial [Chloroflexota bacterium]